MPTIARLSNTGIFYANTNASVSQFLNGGFDEITSNGFSVSNNFIFVPEMDEITPTSVPLRLQSNKLTVNNIFNEIDQFYTTPVPPLTYTLEIGTKAPVLGAGGQSPFPASGWTSRVSSSVDDAFLNIALPFIFTYNNVGYTNYFPGSNFYITFGAGSSVFSALSAGNPELEKIHISAADNSWQRVSTISSGTNFHRIRVEGTNSTSGTPGSPNLVYELTFFNPNLQSYQNWIELLVGVCVPRPGAISGIYGQRAQLSGGQMVSANASVSANQSYVLIGNSTGDSWTVYTGYNVGGTGY